MDKIMVFIPMYNCEKQITRVLDQFDKAILKYVSKIVIVNNRSTDNSEEVVLKYIEESNIKEKFVLLRNNKNYNLGGSHKVAFEYAASNNFDYLIVLHGDDQGNIKDLLPYLENGKYKNYDCLLGSRFMKNSKLIGYSKFRTFGNKVYNIIFSLALRKKISDLGSGLNMYNVQIFNGFYHKYEDKLTFNCYMLLAAKEYNHKSIFFPISWREDDQVSNVKMFSQALITLKIALKYSLLGKNFLEKEHRKVIVKKYTAKEISKGENHEK